MKERSFSGSDKTLPPLKGTSEERFNYYDDRYTPTDEDNIWTRSEPHIEIDDIKRKRINSIEAQIHAAAKAATTRVGQEEGEEGMSKDSLSNLRSESIRSAKMAYSESEKPHITVRRPPKNTFDSGIEQGSENGTGDSSSRHEAEFDDDVFSLSEQSKRSSWNSHHEHSSSADQCKKFVSSTNTGEKEETFSLNITSPASSGTSPDGENFFPFTNRSVARSTIQTPSVRGIQMSSPTGSNFPSSSSINRNIPSASNHGTPNSYCSPSKISPSRLKPKKPDPLVLLHLTVMPLNYSYSCLMSSPDLPESLKGVQENWRLLLDKLGSTVLERGILLAHPHDSYETLEERLLEALELPIRPRACILKCGHYISQSGSEPVSSDDENELLLANSETRNKKKPGRKWCDICGRDIRLEDHGGSESYERRFRIKIYASNGLMSAGAWAAAWREMERVDVEIEPFVDTYLHAELKRFASTSMAERDEDYEYKADEMMTDDHFNHDFEHEREEEEMRTCRENREHEMRKEMEQKAGPTKQEEEEQEKSSQFKMKPNYEGEMANKKRRKRDSSRNDSIHDAREENRDPVGARWDRTGDSNKESFSELLIAAARIFIRERRNVIYGILATLAIIFALIIKGPINKLPASYDPVMSNIPLNLKFDSTNIMQDSLTTTIVKEITITRLIPAPSEVTTIDIDSETFNTLPPNSEMQTSKSSDEEQGLQGKVLQIFSPSIIDHNERRPPPKFGSKDKKERSLSI